MSTFCRVHASNLRMTPGETEPEGPFALRVKRECAALLSAWPEPGEVYGGAA